MIATTIGRTFLDAYNDKYKKEMTPKEFFDKEYFDLFYNHPKYLQWITNSPFVQMKKGQSPHNLKLEDRLEKLENLHSKIRNGDQDASVAIGFPASELKDFATTSGQVSDIEYMLSEDDIYYSWIGGGLGVGVAGGYSIFFNQCEILLQVYDGWRVYRRFLNDLTLSTLRGNQINTWNGQWLSFRNDRLKYRDDFDFTSINQQNAFTIKDNLIEVNTIAWSELFFNLSYNIKEEQILAYVYSLGQTNQTLGFYPFYLKEATNLIKYYQMLFGENAVLKDKDKYEQLFGLHIKRACELGAIGLQALEPKDLRKYFNNDKNLKLKKPIVKVKKGESIDEFKIREFNAEQKDLDNLIIFRTYKTWLLAMITKNKDELTNYTSEVAKALHEYRTGTTKTDRKNKIQTELFAAKSKKQFINTIASIVKDVEEESLEIFKNLKDKVHLMTGEEFGYFVVLLKFDYAYQERTIY